MEEWQKQIWYEKERMRAAGTHSSSGGLIEWLLGLLLEPIFNLIGYLLIQLPRYLLKAILWKLPKYLIVGLFWELPKLILGRRGR